MNDAKLKQLFDAARREPAPEAPFNFGRQVVSALDRSAPSRACTASFADELSRLFPKVAALCLIVIGLSLVGVFYPSEHEIGSTADFNQMTEQWFFNADNSLQ